MNNDVLFSRKKIALIACVMAAFVLCVVIVSLVLMNGNGDIVAMNDGQISEGPEISVIFENRDKITDYVGKTSSAIGADFLEETILSESEISTAPRDNEYESLIDGGVMYQATIVTDSFKVLNEEPFIGKFNVKISDGREYKVYLRNDEISYTENYRVGVVMSRVDGDTKAVFAYTNNEDKDMISEWASAVIGGDVEVKYVNTSEKYK